MMIRQLEVVLNGRELVNMTNSRVLETWMSKVADSLSDMYPGTTVGVFADMHPPRYINYMVVTHVYSDGGYDPDLRKELNNHVIDVVLANRDAVPAINAGANDLNETMVSLIMGVFSDATPESIVEDHKNGGWRYDPHKITWWIINDV